MELIERKNCPVCSNIKFKILYSLSYKDKNILEFLNNYYKGKLPSYLLENYEYQLAECNKCKFIFQKYVPDDEFSSKLYDKIISADDSLKKKLDKKNLNLKYDNEINLIKKIFRNKKIKVLEFGAGWGFWASRAIESGLDVDAFEVSDSRIRYMKEKGITVVKDMEKNKNDYDFIYSDQTIEHITDPHQIFKSFLPNLKQGGFILLNYPSSFNFRNKLKRNYLPKKDAAHPLEHINLFSRKSVNFFINKYNLELINFKSKFNPSIRNLLKDIKNFFYFDNILIKKK